MSQFENRRAAAIKYQLDSPAPVVVASGMGYLAEKIVETAQENQIPVYQDNSLATLLSQLHAGTQIPPELFQAIVDIYVYFLRFTLPEIDENPEKAMEAKEGEQSSSQADGAAQ